MPPQMEQQPNKYAFTKPLSLAGPTDADLQRNNDLDKVRFKFLIRLVSFTIDTIRFTLLAPLRFWWIYWRRSISSILMFGMDIVLLSSLLLSRFMVYTVLFYY